MNSIGYHNTTTITAAASWNEMVTSWMLLHCLYQHLLRLYLLFQCTTSIYKTLSKNGMLEVTWSKVVCSQCLKGIRMWVWIRIAKLIKLNLQMLSEKLLLHSLGRDSIIYTHKKNEVSLIDWFWENNRLVICVFFICFFENLITIKYIKIYEPKHRKYK